MMCFGLYIHSHTQRRHLTCEILSLKRPCTIWIRTEMEKSHSRNISVSISLSLSHVTPCFFVLLLGDIWPQFELEREERTDEPEWVKTEREHFSKHRNKNSDGLLDKEEISNWISPPDYDHVHAEAKHLIYEADTNKVYNYIKDLRMITDMLSW